MIKNRKQQIRPDDKVINLLYIKLTYNIICAFTL